MLRSNGPNALNERAKKARQQARLNELRDENGVLTSRLFLVQTVSGVCRFDVMNEKVLAELESLVANMPVTVASEQNVTEKGKKKTAVLSNVDLVLREAPSALAKTAKYPLLMCVLYERMASGKQPEMVELLTAGNKLLALQFEDGDKADSWLREFLEKRLVLLSILLDLCPAFRAITFVKTADGPLRKSTLTPGDAANAAAAGGGVMAASEDLMLLKSAFLQYQRLALSHDIAATSRQQDYEKTVQTTMARLEDQRKKRLELRYRLNALESDVSARKSEFENVTHRLNEIFGSVLADVASVHGALGATHDVLRGRYSDVASRRLPLRDEDRQLAQNFREALDFVSLGLVMDGPLKRQLDDLELREAQGSSELQELEEKLKELQSESDGLRATKTELENVVKSANSLKVSMAEAAAMAQGKLDGKAIHKLVTTFSVAAAEEGVAFRNGVSLTLDKGKLLSATGEEDGSEVKGATASQLVHSVLSGTSRNLEVTLLRTFEYYMKPIAVLEALIMAYTEGPPAKASEAEAAAFERGIGAVRLRALNFLRKWMRMHPTHFSGDPRMKKLVADFLACARLTGNERLVEQIEQDDVAVPAVGGAAAMRDSLAWPILKVGIKHIATLNDVAPEELARQLCLADFRFYGKIQTREFFKCAFMKKGGEAPNIRIFTDRFNHVSRVVASHILGAEGGSDGRLACLNVWLRVLQHLRLLHNYQSLLAVVGGLSSSPIARLKSVWSAADADTMSFFEDCKSLMDKNFSKLRAELSAAPHPVVPYLGGYQRDLVYLDENATFKGNAINMSKFTSISDVLENCLRFQDRGYTWLQEVPAVQAVIDSFPLLSEEQAHQMSLTAEPRRGSVAAATPQQQPPTVEERAPRISLRRGSEAPPVDEVALRKSQTAPIIVIAPPEPPEEIASPTAEKKKSPRVKKRSPRRSTDAAPVAAPTLTIPVPEMQLPLPTEGLPGDAAAQDTLSVEGAKHTKATTPRLKRVSLRRKIDPLILEEHDKN